VIFKKKGRFLSLSLLMPPQKSFLCGFHRTVVLHTPFDRCVRIDLPIPMPIKDSISVEEQAYLVEYMPQIDEDEMFHNYSQQ
jgi:hypothetical protein